MRLLQVVPRIDPEREGVSAVAAAIAHEMGLDGAKASDLFGLGDEAASTFSSAPSRHPRSAGIRAAELVHRAAQLGSGDALLLHYVGYGYQSRGVPAWLASAWESVKRERGGLRLGVVFHEVYATGAPWQSSFWLSAWQRSIARRLLRAADVALTSLPRYRSLLAAMVPERIVDVLPIPSTVGEPRFVPAHAERQPRLVLFGSAGVRERAYRGERAALEGAARELGVHEIVDIGGGNVAPQEIAGVPVRAMGQLPGDEVGRMLLDARAGFLAYPPDYLDKSTIFGAYLAHGLVPVCAWSSPRGRSPRADEVWVRATANGVEENRDLQAVAQRAREAYAGRSIARHAELWKRRLFPE